MANLKSSKKAIRQTKKRTFRNTKVKNEIKRLIKELDTLISEGKQSEASKKFVTITKKLDKAAKVRVIHANTASRYKSRLSKKINAIPSKK